MKNSTFSAQVANNLLTLLQGYTKGIRFVAILTMLCTIGVGQMWGAEANVYTSNVELSTTSGTKATASKAKISSVDYNAMKLGSSGNAGNFYVTIPANTTTLTLHAAAWNGKTSNTLTLSTETAGVTISPSAAQTLPANSGVSGSSTTYTITANDTKEFFTYTITGATSGARIKLACSERCLIWGVNAETSGATPPTPSTTYTIKWHTAVGTTTDDVLNEGADITKPATDPTMSGYVFRGWTEACEVASNGSDFTAITDFGTATEDKDFYAVFAKATTTGGGGEEKDFSFNITTADFNTTSYVANNKEKTSTAKASDGSTMEVKWTSNQVMLQSGVMQWQKNNGFIFNSTDLGTIKSVEITKTDGTFTTYYGTSKQPSNGTTVGNGYFQIKIGSTTGKSSNIKVTFTQTVAGGGGTTTYDNYITTCAGSTPTYTITSTLSHVTANGENPTTITSEDTELKLRYSAQDGWNLPDAIAVTMGGTPLSNDDYVWDKTTGDLLIIGGNVDFAFTGDIVVTINGWQQLAAPQNLQAASITATSATLSWNAVANASSYIVNVVDGASFQQKYPVTGTTKTLDNLTPSTDYLWTVTAVGDGTNYTNSEESATGEFTTSAATYTITYVTNGGTKVESTSGTALPNPLPTTTRDHYTLEGWYTDQECTQAATAGATINANTTLYAKWTPIIYTVSFDAGSGTCATGSTQGNFETGITLPTATPSTTCHSEGWTFVGWWTEAVTETTTSPGELLTADSNYKPTKDCTLYAVYSHTEAGGGVSEVQFNFGYTDWGKDASFSGNTLDQVTQAKEGIDVTYTRNEGSLYANTTSLRFYKSNTLTFDAGSNTITAITFTGAIGQTDITTDVNSCSNTSSSLSWSGNSSSVTFTRPNDASSYATLTSATLTISGSTYYHSTPSCVPTYSITYDFAGGTGSHCSNTSVPQGDTYTICDEAPTREGYTFQGWSDGTSIHAAGATFKPTGDVTLTALWQIKTYTVTWSNNGTTTDVPYNHGDELQLPTAPASCDGVKEFVGWTTHSGYYHATTAPDDIFTTKTTPVTATATYYAVFATPPGTGGGGATPTTTEDVLTRDTTGIENQVGTSSYSDWSGKKATSSAVYAGNSAGGNNAIQLRSDKSTSGIVTTTSGGKATKVEVEWQSGTSSGRTLDIYGRNVAYSAATDLYSNNTQGTKLGSITYGTSTELEITGDYEYIGLRSNSGAMYLASVTITWSSAGGSSSHTDYTTTCQEVTGIALSGSYPTTFIQFDAFSFAGGIVTATLENGTTQDVTELATFSGYNMDEVGVQTVTVTYMGQTAKYEITINQSDRWRLTWNVSGKTNTGASPIYVQKGNAIGKLPTPEVPAACAGKTFMGWTTSNIVHSDGTGITYITPETVPTDNTTYYAVFATINNFSVQKPIDEIASGSKVVIVAVASLTDNGGAGKAISSRATDDTHNLQGDDVAIYDQTINTPHSTCIWTLTKSGEKYIFTQDGKYLNGIIDGTYSNLKYDGTSDEWTLTPSASGMARTYNMESTNASGEYIEWYNEKFTIHNDVNNNGAFDMQFFVTANAAGNADTTDYTTGCAEYTITYYGFHGGYSTSCSSDGTIVLPVNSIHTIPNCEGLVINDHTNLGRTFTGVWMTKPHGGHTFKPGDTFILTQDTTLYAQWKMETTSDVTTLPTDIEDLAGTDIYVYGGKTLTLQPGTTTINSLTLKGGIQKDGSYKMPTVWVPEGATLIRKSNKIYLDLVVNAQTYYPFAVPFAAKNNANVEYLDPVLAAASTYGKHFVIKTYDGANRAKVGEDKTNNWVSVRRDSTLQPGVGYIITALTRPTEDTATIRIPMTVPDTWFNNGEQAAVGTTVRNTIAVTAHAGAAATKHPRHAGWNFVANPYLTNFTGGNVANDGDLAYINGELIIEGSYEYGGEDVPYVTIPAYNFASYSQQKLSEAKLSPAYSFFVQVDHGGTMNFTTAGRQQAPASIAARNAEERPVKMDVDLILSDNHSSDQTGIIISDRYTDAYEIGHDLEKLFGSAYNLSVYTLMEDNTPLAFQALAIRSSMQVIPVGYRAPEQGEYTFRLNEATSSIDLLNEQYEQLVLVDYQTGELTNLLYTDYTFYSERTQSNARFAIYAVPRQNAPTDLPNAISQDKQAQKILHNGHLYILRDGNVYNGNGQIVK